MSSHASLSSDEIDDRCMEPRQVIIFLNYFYFVIFLQIFNSIGKSNRRKETPDTRS